MFLWTFLSYRVYLPNGQDIESPPHSTHFSIKGVNTLLVTQTERQSTVLLGMGVSTDAQSQGTIMSRSWSRVIPSRCLAQGVLLEAPRCRDRLIISMSASLFAFTPKEYARPDLSD